MGCEFMFVMLFFMLYDGCCRFVFLMGVGLYLICRFVVELCMK